MKKMFNKLILENLDKPFVIKFIGQEHNVPTGKFEAEATLGNFILSTAKKWKLKVEKIGEPQAPKVEAIKEVAPIKIIEEKVVEEVKEVKKVSKK